MPKPTVDEVLLDALANGNLLAFEQIIRIYLPFVLAIAYRNCHHRDQAREITNQTFVQLWKDRENGLPRFLKVYFVQTVYKTYHRSFCRLSEAEECHE